MMSRLNRIQGQWRWLGLQHTRTMANVPPQVGRIVSRKNLQQKKAAGSTLHFRNGAPFVLFSVLAAWVVGNALHGRLKEREVATGHVSQSLREAKLKEEQEEMMERLNKIVAQDFDNTKRIKRPEEILEERRAERKRRNAWHRRLYRSLVGDNS